MGRRCSWWNIHGYSICSTYIERRNTFAGNPHHRNDALAMPTIAIVSQSVSVRQRQMRATKSKSTMRTKEEIENTLKCVWKTLPLSTRTLFAHTCNSLFIHISHGRMRTPFTHTYPSHKSIAPNGNIWHDDDGNVDDDDGNVLQQE